MRNERCSGSKRERRESEHAGRQLGSHINGEKERETESSKKSIGQSPRQRKRGRKLQKKEMGRKKKENEDKEKEVEEEGKEKEEEKKEEA